MERGSMSGRRGRGERGTHGAHTGYTDGHRHLVDGTQDNAVCEANHAIIAEVVHA